MNEFTIVCLLEASDSTTFRNGVSQFPKSHIVQLPPHLTILSRIISAAKKEQLIEKFGEIGALSILPLEINTGEPIIWYHEKYCGFAVAVEVELNDEISYLRKYLTNQFSELCDSKVRDLWVDFQPHITISLKIDENEVEKVSKLSVSRFAFPASKLQLLQHGGDYYGYTRIASISLSGKTESIE